MQNRLGDRITGFLVQPMARGLAEAIIGYRLDPTVGPVIALGAGGVLAELYRDVTLRLAPVTEDEAMDMIRSVKGLAPILGYRNLPRGHAPALARAVAAFSRLAGIPARHRGRNQPAHHPARRRRHGRRTLEVRSMTHPLLPRLRQARVVPVIRTASTEHARQVVQWLHSAGLRIFEITMSVPDAPALIKELAADPSLLIGAGTVPDAHAAEICLHAGAAFLVAPWVDPTLSAPTRAANALLMLGAITPTEVRAARTAGADVVKIFPASSVGGPAHIRALRSVLPDVPFCPTGGVEPANTQDYLDAGAAFVGIGGALVSNDRAKVQAAAQLVLTT